MDLFIAVIAATLSLFIIANYRCPSDMALSFIQRYIM